MEFIKNRLKRFIFNSNRTKLIIKNYNFDPSYAYVWGMKKSGNALKKKFNSSKIIYLEDGFINSFGYYKNKIPLSICLDKQGIYYDCNSNSKLFEFVKEELNNKDELRSKQIINLWRKYAISKYNFPKFIDPPNEKYILLIDQTYGDLSIKYGMANKESFSEMFNFARKNWPDHKILIKVHPDVITSKKKGCLDKNFFSLKNVVVISKLGQINKLLEFSSAVCVVTSQVGFEALIYGKEVHVFGRPFYSGLGLTIDHKSDLDLEKTKSVKIEQLVFASLVKYQYYVDPRTKKNVEVENIMELINKKREISKKIPANLFSLNLSPWKARQINRFVYEATGAKVKPLIRFNSSIKNIIIWGKSYKYDKYLSKVDNLISVEDGFVRSRGLGGELYPPLSLLFDKKGIHYDPSNPSDLEELLQNKYLNNNELHRAKKLMQKLIKSNISKYNLDSRNKNPFPNTKLDKELIVVLGQVETDNSIKFGVPNDTIAKTNFSLVKQVKVDYPNSFIVYKPHPDLESGLRRKGSKESSIGQIADYVANKTSLEDIFRKVDRVIVFTSLGGFEALIRGIPVTTYGFPFYSGWGITEDKLINNSWKRRRTRKLTVEELIYITLIEYPLYFSLKNNTFTDIEHIIDELNSNKNKNKNLEQVIFRYWGIIKDLISRSK